MQLNDKYNAFYTGNRGFLIGMDEMFLVFITQIQETFLLLTF